MTIPIVAAASGGGEEEDPDGWTATEEGAYKQAEIIRRHWKARGHVMDVRVVRLANTHNQQRFGARSISCSCARARHVADGACAALQVQEVESMLNPRLPHY